MPAVAVRGTVGSLLKNLFQDGPICNVHFAEQIEVRDHGEARLILEQGIDGFHKAISKWFARKSLQQAAAVVFNAEALKKVADQLLVSSEQPGLKHLNGGVIVAFPGQFVVHPCMALYSSLSIQNYRTKLSPRGEHVKACPIGPFVAGVEILKDFSRRFFREPLQNLVGFHGRAFTRVTESEWENMRESSTLKI